MTGKKEPGAGLRHITVTVREDIFVQANEAGIDISDVCNRALADLVGIDYYQQQTERQPVSPPVIIAAERSVAGSRSGTPKITPVSRPPVINADDPAAVAKAMRSKHQTAVKPVPDGPKPPATDTGKEARQLSPLPDTGPRKKSQRTGPKKREAGGGLKKFVTEKISRIEADNAVISKDELYQAFSRWCREQKITPVPDRKVVAVALKNQFALQERTEDGIPYWVNIHLR